jgi:DNA-binding transcriptional ArsR family regulator
MATASCCKPPPHVTKVDVFDAIASPIRRSLLDALRDGPVAVHDLAADLPISRPAVSQHLRVLLDAELVIEERVGRERRYRLDAAPLQQVQGWVGHYETFWSHKMRSLQRFLDQSP